MIKFAAVMYCLLVGWDGQVYHLDTKEYKNIEECSYHARQLEMTTFTDDKGLYVFLCELSGEDV